MTRTASKSRGDKAKCDVLFSKIIRARGRCQYCGETRYELLQCAHIVSRRYSHTRTDERNALALCARCHHYFTDHPTEFGTFVQVTLGRANYQSVFERSQGRGKFDWSAELLRLRALASGMDLQ